MGYLQKKLRVVRGTIDDMLSAPVELIAKS
jgi:hypothetical protein